MDRRTALKIGTVGIFVAADHLRSNPATALEACIPQTTASPRSCLMEGYLEVGAYLFRGPGKLTDLAQIDTWIPGRPFRVTFSSKLKEGAVYDPNQELTGEGIAGVVNFTHSGIAVARLITAEAGRGFAQRALDASGKPFADDNLQEKGFQYLTNPNTGHPAILVAMQSSEIELRGPGFNKQTKSKGVIEKVAYMVEVLNDDGTTRVGNNKLVQRFYQTMGVCPREFGIPTDQDVSSTEINDYHADDLKRNIPVELPWRESLLK